MARFQDVPLGDRLTSSGSARDAMLLRFKVPLRMIAVGPIDQMADVETLGVDLLPQPPHPEGGNRF
jgi:hypothetical protein